MSLEAPSSILGSSVISSRVVEAVMMTAEFTLTTNPSLQAVLIQVLQIGARLLKIRKAVDHVCVLLEKTCH